MNLPWLTILLLLPILGSLVLVLVPARAFLGQPHKQIALGFSVVTLVLGVALAVGYDTGGGMQYTEDLEWIQLFGAHYALGLDGIGLTLVLLTVILTPVVMLASWNDGELGRWGAKGFFAWILALEGLSIGVFAATDVFLFYVFFEATLIPVYFLVAGYGGPDRVRAAVKFLLFSLAGGLVMLASVIGLYVESAKTEGGPTYLISELADIDFGTWVGRWMFLGFFIAFAIKAPMFPVHTWLPDTTAERHPGHLGAAGQRARQDRHLRDDPVLPRDLPGGLALGDAGRRGAGDHQHPVRRADGDRRRNNIPRLIAYTSVSHFGFIVLGIFVMNSQGLSGANLYMFNHGLSTAALFLVTGFLITRRGSALISDYGGVEKVAPVLAGLFLVAGLSSLSLPGLSPFVSEMLVMVGAFVHSPWAAAFAVLGIVLAAIYILWMYQRTMTGPVRAGGRRACAT